MPLQGGSLLMARLRLTLPNGTTTVDTGLQQASYATDPGVDGRDPVDLPPDGRGSRVMVMPEAPLLAWASITHGEPYLGTNGTVEVVFTNAGAETTIVVLFWDPSTVPSPVSADTYTAPPSVPTVSSYAPDTGLPGDTVTVTGTNFLNNVTAVTVGGIEATFINVDATTITLTLPVGFATGTIDVTTPWGTGVGPPFTRSRWRQMTSAGDGVFGLFERLNHQIITLNDGRFLCVGGQSGATAPVDGGQENFCYAYTPSTDTWAQVGSMITARRFFASVKLADGRVLISGGGNSGAGALNTAEIFTPGADTWAAAGGTMSVARASHTMDLMADGRVLVSGGFNAAVTSQLTSEVFTSGVDTFGTSRNMPVAREQHGHVVLTDGRVMLISGVSSGGGTFGTTAFYTPAADTWAAGPVMGTPRKNCGIALLPNNKVIAVGGDSNALGGTAVTTVELMTPGVDTWAATGSLSTAKILPQVIALDDGSILEAGGSDSIGTILLESSIYTQAGATWVATDSRTLYNTLTQTGCQERVVKDTLGRVFICLGTAAAVGTALLERYTP